jgi:hypothetical protein
MYITEEIRHSLNSTMAVSSEIESISLATEYMTNWFLDKYPKNYFTHVHIDMKHVLDDFKSFTPKEVIKIQKPNLSITPVPQFEFNRDNVDFHPYGLDNYIRYDALDEALFQDTANNRFIALVMKVIQVNYTFRVRFETRAQQIDCANYMKLRHRVGATQENWIGIDVHVPDALMRVVARDAGYLNEDGKIINPIEFTGYLNSCSQIPFLVKFMNIQGRYGFYVRIRETYAHIAIPDTLDIDEGEKDGQIYTNFVVTMNAACKFPAPNYFAYYSKTYHERLMSSLTDSHNHMMSVHMTKMPDIKEFNDRGWALYGLTDYTLDEAEYEKRPIIINIEEFLKNDEVSSMIEYVKDVLKMHPTAFLDFSVFSAGISTPYVMDWDAMTMTLEDIYDSMIVNIVVYADIGFMRDQSAVLDSVYKGRMKILE